MSNTNIYGYLNASLHYAYYKKTAIERNKKIPIFQAIFFKATQKKWRIKLIWMVDTNIYKLAS